LINYPGGPNLSKDCCRLNFTVRPDAAVLNNQYDSNSQSRLQVKKWKLREMDLIHSYDGESSANFIEII